MVSAVLVVSSISVGVFRWAYFGGHFMEGILFWVADCMRCVINDVLGLNKSFVAKKCVLSLLTGVNRPYKKFAALSSQILCFLSLALCSNSIFTQEVFAQVTEEAMQLPEGSSPVAADVAQHSICLLYTSPSPRDRTRSRMPSSA